MGIKLTEVGVTTCTLKLAYLKTIPGILKILELIIATIVLCLIAYFINNPKEGSSAPISGELFFLVIIVTFTICIFCLFISEWIIWSEIESSSKSMFEIVFFVVATILLFASSVNLLTNVYEDSSIRISYVVMAVLEVLLIGLYSTDIIISLCSNCCRKKETTIVEQ